MSKTDAMRAMKQARAEEAAAARPAGRPAVARPRPAVATAAAPAAAAAAVDVPVPDLVPEPLCGHQAIGGRRCTRPQGHAEKNHRYAT